MFAPEFSPQFPWRMLNCPATWLSSSGKIKPSAAQPWPSSRSPRVTNPMDGRLEIELTQEANPQLEVNEHADFTNSGASFAEPCARRVHRLFGHPVIRRTRARSTRASSLVSRHVVIRL